MVRKQEEPIVWHGHSLVDDTHWDRPHWQYESKGFDVWVAHLGPEHYHAVLDLKNHKDPEHQIGGAGASKTSAIEALDEAMSSVTRWVNLTMDCFRELKCD